MTPQDLLEAMRTVVDAPDGVDRLRECVLHLAVRGHLVPQDPDDPPARALLGQIRMDKATFVDANGLKRVRELQPVSTKEISHDLPEGWEWCRLGDVANPQAGFAFKSQGFNEAGEGLPLVRIRDVVPGSTKTYYAGEYRHEFIVNDGDYLVGMDGNFNIGRWRGGRALLNQRVTRLQWYTQNCIPRFVVIALQERLNELQGVKAYTTVQHLSGRQIEDCVIPLPPLAEQRRIVARVDELMALLDELERARDERDAKRTAFRDSALAALRNAEDADAVRAAWSRVAAHMGDLFTDPADIAPLRQTILQLAVRGRLIPQDPNDEPVQVTLAKARAKAGLGQWREADFEPIPMQVPESWIWVSIPDVAESRLGKMLDKAKNAGDPYPYIRNTNVHWFRFELGSVKRMLLKSTEVAEFRLQDGDVLICEGGHGIGRAAVWHEQVANAVFQKALHRVRPLACLDSDFLSYCIRVYDSIGFLQTFYTGAGIPHLTGKSLAKVPFPLPPLAEQRRIVTKVDELIAICDELEQRLTKAKAYQAAFAAAAVHHLDVAANDSLHAEVADLVGVA